MTAARVALVLGAGGIVGQAYHAGVLAALENDLGWDPRAADLIVGTSAGSVTGTLLRRGVPASDLAAWAVNAPLSVEGAAVIDRLEANRDGFPRFDPRGWLRTWRPPPLALVGRLARDPRRFRATAALTTMMPPGRIDITHSAEILNDAGLDGWPPGLWICAAGRADGRRAVFGRRGSPSVPLARAVAASCAIPGVFAPVRIGSVEYLDGGVHSPTNADVLKREAFDLVLIVSPMSVAGGRARTFDAPLRWLNHRRLEREIRLLKASGTVVVRVEPDARSLSVMGVNAMAEDRSDRVILESFIEAGAYVASPVMRERLLPISRNPSRRTS